jgi:hypothetical protein
MNITFDYQLRKKLIFNIEHGTFITNKKNDKNNKNNYNYKNNNNNKIITGHQL